MLALGVVQPSSSSWSSSILLVKKTNGEHRLGFDGRKLNSVTKRDAYPLPYVSRILAKLRDGRFLSCIRFGKCILAESIKGCQREKCVFTVSGTVLFEFTRMAFGLHNSP